VSVAIVTGGASGIGKATVDRLVQDDWTVFSWDVSSRQAALRALDQKVDVTDRTAIEEALAEVRREYGTVDLLVNAAGSTRRGPTETLAWQDWSTIIDVNLHGTFNCMQAVGQQMLATGHGSIVNVASIAAERGGVGRAPYCASKAGVVALTRVAGVEWAARGVRVNAVGPGWTKTPLLDTTVHDPEALDVLLRLVPARRLAEPEEIAAVITFLASAEASFINAQVIYVDGGYMADFQLGLS
jgi:3-oxoacyl-[acyl-carrier protein] reductase